LELPTTLPDQSWLAIACFLVDHGADLDAVDMRGNTPITHIKNDAVIDLLRKRARSAIDNRSAPSGIFGISVRRG